MVSKKYNHPINVSNSVTYENSERNLPIEHVWDWYRETCILDEKIRMLQTSTINFSRFIQPNLLSNDIPQSTSSSENSANINKKCML